MTITLFIEPKSLPIFLEVNRILRELPLENNYVFQPSDLIFSKTFVSNYIWINMEIEEYLKFEYCYHALLNKK